MSDDPARHWADIVASRAPTPLDVWAVAALLESEGLRDLDAQELGYAGVFAFAERVYRIVRGTPSTLPPPAAPPTLGLRRELRALGLGSSFAFAVAGQVACLGLTGHSLWATLDLDEAQATVMGVGTLASLVVTGGLTVALGRDATRYRNARAYGLLLRACLRLVALGAAVVVVALAVACALRAFYPFLDLDLFALASAYFVLMSVLWLGVGVLYALRESVSSHVLLVAITISGGLIVSALVDDLGWGLHAAHLSAAALTAAVTLAVGFLRLHRLVPSSDPKAEEVALPPPDVAAGRLLPYALYGLGYASLLAVDRAIVWTSPASGAPQAVWVHMPYERGMVWALATALLPLSVLELLSDRFWSRLSNGQHELVVTALRAHRREVGRTLARLGATLAALSFVSVALVWAAGRAFARSASDPMLRALLRGEEVERVFWLAATGYQLLAWGLFVGLLYSTLGRNLPVLRAIWSAVAVSCVVGYAASRALPPGWTALGFTAGTALFAWRMLRAGRALAGRIDAYYFAAY